MNADNNLSVERSRKRIAYIDAAKGIGIMLVVIGHFCPNGAWDIIPFTHMSVTKWIYSFHMPFFYMVSGFAGKRRVFRDLRGFCEFAEKIFVGYFIPYLLMMLVLDGFSIDKLKDYLMPRQEVLVRYSAIASWWLPSLIVVVVIVQIIDEICWLFLDIPAIWIIGCVVCFSVGMLLDGRRVGNQAWYWNIALVGVGFYCMGRVLKFFVMPVVERGCFSIKACCGGVILTAALLHFVNQKNDVVYMVIGMYGNKIIFVSGAIAGSILMLLMGRVLEGVRVLRYIGANSIVIMEFHGQVLSWLNYYAVPIILDKVDNNYLPYIRVALGVAAVMLMLPLIYMIMRFVPELGGKHGKGRVHTMGEACVEKNSLL